MAKFRQYLVNNLKNTAQFRIIYAIWRHDIDRIAQWAEINTIF